MAEIGSRAKVAVSWIGKWKTTIQMIAIAGLIWRDSTLIFEIENWMVYASLVLMVVATILTIWSMVDYLIVGVASINDETMHIALDEQTAKAQDDKPKAKDETLEAEIVDEKLDPK